MKLKGEQYTTHHCFVCGEENQLGLNMKFYETEDGRVLGIFRGKRDHCSYPDRMHGGIISAILDEVIGRCIELRQPGCLGVTTQLNVKFRKPVPTGVELKVLGTLVQDTPRGFEGHGEILLPDGSVAASADAIYFKCRPGAFENMGDELLYHDGEEMPKL